MRRRHPRLVADVMLLAAITVAVLAVLMIVASQPAAQ